MFAKQLSVFLENKSGSLAEVTSILGEAGVNLSSINIGDGSDFGILRCIVDNPDAAQRALRDAGYAVKLTNLIGFRCPNEPGALSKIFRLLSDHGVFIEYMNSFNNGEQANIVLRPTDFDGCQQVLQEQHIDLLSPEEMYRL